MEKSILKLNKSLEYLEGFTSRRVPSLLLDEEFKILSLAMERQTS
jgi:hypothetical protein